MCPCFHGVSFKGFSHPFHSSVSILSSTCCVLLDDSPQMEALLSAVLGEATSRSIDFFIRKCSKPKAQDVEDRLRRVLLRAQVIIEEAMVRQIRNQAMLLQLDMLRGAMHRGYSMLDTFRYQSHDKEDAENQVVSQPLSLCKVNSLKYFCSSDRKTQVFEQLKEVLDSLNSTILNANETVIFLMSYPRMYRQPYCMHILLANCMFDRKMETELVIGFLLHTKAHSDDKPEVLPIVGPGRVGKSTLVAHVCNDERIHDHFSEVKFLTDHDFRNGMMSVHRQGCAMENQFFTTRKDGQLLVIVEVAGDVTVDAWKKLCSAFRRSTSNGNKIIITSRSDKIMKLGTTGVGITLTYLSNEAYWYFFRTLTFGSTDPEQHRRLASVAMDIATTLSNKSLVAANVIASLLRNNFDINFWCKVLAFIRGFVQKNIAKFGEHPSDLLTRNRSAYLGRMHRACEDIKVNDQYQCPSQEAVPNITLLDVMYGSVKPRRNFEVLVWRSRMPPYYNYIFACQTQDLKTIAAKRKRSPNDGIIP